MKSILGILSIFELGQNLTKISVRWIIKEGWLIFKNTHEAIIDQETFDIVQKMRSHKRSNQRYKNRIGHKNLFAGLVFCGTCGRKHYFCPQEKNGLNHDHYKCSGYRKPIDGCENPHYIQKSALIEIVSDKLRQTYPRVPIRPRNLFEEARTTKPSSIQ